MGLSTIQNKHNIQDYILHYFQIHVSQKTEKRQINGLIGVIRHIVIFQYFINF